MDIDSLFGSSSSSLSKDVKTLQMLVKKFMEMSFSLAEIIDQLNVKLVELEERIQQVERRPAAAPAGAAPTARATPAVSAPSEIGPPPLPGGMAPPQLPGGATTSAPSGFPAPPASGGIPAPPGGGGSPRPPAPSKPSPMMFQAQMKNELAEAFKKIRANLDKADL